MSIIIAEAGVNHNGSIEIAKKLAMAAKIAGADYVKFQTFCPENLVSKYAEKCDYQKEQTGGDESQLDMLKKLALPYEDFAPLKQYCEDIGIHFMSTPFDLDSIELLEKLNIEIFKVPSGEITNYPYLLKLAESKKPIILSTGMSELEEVRKAVELLKANHSGKITLLHCTTEYPAPFEEINLKAMKTMEEEFDLPVGYSDHSVGIEVSIAAAALGAAVIEKHFTLDRNMEGPDHKASLEPDELIRMVRSIRNVEASLGNGIKTASWSEKKNIEIVRKSIVAKKDIQEGELLTVKNITVKRPGTGISPMKWNHVIGTKAVKSFKEDEMIII